MKYFGFIDVNQTIKQFPLSFIFQASYFELKRATTSYYKDEVTAGCAHLLVKETMRKLSGPKFPGCPRPCTNPKYKMSKFGLNMWAPRVRNTSRLFVYFSSTDVKRTE